MSAQPVISAESLNQAMATQRVREFFGKCVARDHFIASYVGQKCGLTPLATLAALAHLLETNEIAVHVSAGGLYWAFSRRGRA